MSEGESAKRRILIGCPSGSGSPGHLTVQTMTGSMLEGIKQGWVVDIFFRNNDSMITRARDFIFSSFLHHPHYTDLLFIDDDVSADKGSFTRLMQHPVDIVGGAYRARADAEHYVCKPLEHGMMQFDKETKLMEVEAAPTGFLRITRKAAEQIVAARPDDWYEDPTVPKDIKLYSVFDNYFDHEHHIKWSEDYYFCRRYREICGGRVWVDPMLNLHHTGTKTFSGCFFDYMQKTQAMRAQKPANLIEASKGLIDAVKRRAAAEAKTKQALVLENAA